MLEAICCGGRYQVTEIQYLLQISRLYSAVVLNCFAGFSCLETIGF